MVGSRMPLCIHIHLLLCQWIMLFSWVIKYTKSFIPTVWFWRSWDHLLLFDQLMLCEFGYIHKHRMTNLSDFFFVKFMDFSCFRLLDFTNDKSLSSLMEKEWWVTGTGTFLITVPHFGNNNRKWLCSICLGCYFCQ